MKRCPHCRETKPLAEFAIDRSKRSGLKSWCRSCDREKSRRYYQANRERKLAAANARAARLRGEGSPLMRGRRVLIECPHGGDSAGVRNRQAPVDPGDGSSDQEMIAASAGKRR